MLILLLFITMFILMFLGMDIFVSMGVASAIYLLVSGNAPLTLISNSMINGISNFSLLAIPFFILAGELMNVSGMTLRMLNFARFFIGKWKGGLAYACIIINVIIAGVSGSAPADCSAVSSVLLPAMKDEDYPTEFSAAINAAAAVIGPIIPPSIPMVFMSLITNLSVGRLFLGGVIPGILMGVSLAIICYFKIRRMNIKTYEPKHSFKDFVILLKDSYLALIAPLIILLGVILGFATITEIAIVATAYVLIIGIFVYKTIRINDILNIFKSTILFSSSIMAIFSIAGIFSWFIAVEGIGEKLGSYIIATNMSPTLFLLFINILFLLLGMIMDAIPAMLIFVPILMPIAIELGIDPIHLGVVIITNLMIGLLTPPVGGLLYVETKMSNVPFNMLTKELFPFIVALFVVLILMTYVPSIVTLIPNLVF